MLHRLGAVRAGHKRYQRAPVIVYAASNSCRNRSFQPDVHASRKKAAERSRRLRVKRCGLDYAARPKGRRRFVAFTACVFKNCNIDKLRPQIDIGTEIEMPNNKLKWDKSNPTGHGIVFLSRAGYVFCYVQPGGV
jgi:hypothetical protein